MRLDAENEIKTSERVITASVAGLLTVICVLDKHVFTPAATLKLLQAQNGKFKTF